MNPDRMEEIYDLRLDLPEAKVCTVRRYSPKKYRSADWKGDDRRTMAGIGGVLLLVSLLLLMSAYAG